jgi:hypothetical protein
MVEKLVMTKMVEGGVDHSSVVLIPFVPMV